MSVAAAVAELEAVLGGAVRRDVAVAEHTTYRLGGPAAAAVQVDDLDAVRAVARVVAREQPPVLVVGRGSNLLVADRGFPGLVLVLGREFERVDLETVDLGTPTSVRAGAAVALPVLARRSAAAGLTGLEFFVGIPGSVGGAVRMNAGGHGRETRDVLRRAWVLDLADGGDAQPRPREAAALDFGYRSSALAPYEIVTAAEWSVAGAPAGECEARVADIVAWRRAHQPGGANAGSVFRNPDGDSAGRLVEDAGCKGLRVGGAVVSDKHANFFQAEPGATADDVAQLVREVRRRVHEASGVDLTPELLMVGFPPEQGEHSP